MPWVSVIVPCYNHAHYLTSAINSILAQTFHDWEAIIIDDGSVDNTREIATEFADPRLHYIYQENQGLSTARNTGIHAAGGEYLAFLDADDMWEPEFLSRCVDVLRADPSLVGVYTCALYVDEQGDVLPQPCGIVVPPQSFRKQLLEGGFFPVHAAVVRCDVVYEAGLFDPRLIGVADWDLWLSIAARHSLYGIDSPLARYRVVANSMSMQSAQMHQHRLIVLEKHFGAAEGNIVTWTLEKRRAYGYVYRATAYDYLQQQRPDESWSYLQRAVKYWPQLLADPNTFYELACGTQPRGYHGQVQQLDLEAVQVELLIRVKNLLAADVPNLDNWRRVAYANAWLALTVLNQRAENWATAQRCLTAALQANPNWLLSVARLRWWLGLTWQRLHGATMNLYKRKVQ